MRDSVVHRLVTEHFLAFTERVDAEGGRPLPRYVVRDFEAYVRCGVLACGFMRARCPTCGHDRLVAFSCKHRGVCSSCGGRRMSETAANLVDRVIPAVPVRQWVLSLPWSLRLPVARDAWLLNVVARAFFEEIRRWLRSAAGWTAPGVKIETGAVTFVQRFGGSLNLNPHLHVLVVDGVFHCTDDGASPRFVETPAPTRGELRAVLERVHARVLATLEARRVGERSDTTDDTMEALRRTATGAGTFGRVRDDGHLDDADADDAGSETARGASRALVAEFDGFNVHAGVRVEASDRVGLERLCRYMGRPPVATGRVSVLPDGNVAYRVKSPRSAAKTHRIMTPVEFIARLAALVPPPRHPLVRYHGVLAPNSPWRVAVVPWPAPAAPVAPAAIASTRVEAAGPAKPSSHRIDWATLLRRVWDLDVLRCPGCDGRMRMIAAIEDRTAIVKILEHLGVPTELPRMTRSRDGPWA